MRQPLWKRLLSYLTEIHIESAPSEINPHLYVSLKRGRYQLCTANAIYSYEDLYDNFSTAFEHMKWEELDIQRVLILGFGLGSIPLILEQQFQKKYHYTAIEIDENVLYLANKYALPAIHSPIELICADAAAFVAQCQEQFDMIAVDVFLDDTIPDTIQQSDFLRQLRSILNPNGVLLYNRLAVTREDIEGAHEFYDRYFSRVFESGTFLEVKGNWMLFNRSDVLK
ncbi:MAG: methyltransferase domain-containing protein [Bacteroidota bacterium]